MFTKLFEGKAEPPTPVPKEGDLFKVITCYGVTFEIRYGYYEERDRYAKFAEPIAIYPDFTKAPRYTEDGIPFATAMQLPCESFRGEQDENSTCEDCFYYQKSEELLGICTCSRNKKSADTGQQG